MSIFGNIFDSQSISISIPKPKPVQFYWHIKHKELSIAAVAPYFSDDEDITNIKMDFDLAQDLINGVENINLWNVIRVGDDIVMRHDSELEKEKVQRLESLSIYELVEDKAHPDVRVIVNDPNHKDSILVYYNGDTIYNWNVPAKIYITSEDDVSYLKCALTISPASLDNILKKNKLKEWPNPIILPINDADDVSVFTTRSKQTIAIFRHDENANNRI